MAYADFALRHPHLYRAMHAPELWHAQSDLDAQPSRANEKGIDKARTWMQLADGSRQAAFKEFELAIETTQTAGRVRADPQGQSRASAHLLTAIVDGFLFHHFAEGVGARNAIGRPRSRHRGETKAGWTPVRTQGRRRERCQQEGNSFRHTTAVEQSGGARQRVLSANIQSAWLEIAIYYGYNKVHESECGGGQEHASQTD